MNVTFLQNDYLDTLIVNTADGTPLYQVETPFKILHRTTSIRRAPVIPGVGSGDLVAEIQWAAIHWRSSDVTYRGVTVKMSQLLDRPHFFSTSRVFTGQDGREYKWKNIFEFGGNVFQLFDVVTKQLVAESHPRSIGIIGPSTKLNVDISSQAIHMVDDIIVTFIIVAQEEQRRKNGRNRSMQMQMTAGTF